MVDRFIVPGRPAVKGSTVSFFARRSQRIVTKSDSALLKAWTRDVQLMARAATVPLYAHGTPVRVTAIFVLPRPIKAGPRVRPCVRPDIDKLARALLDALTGIAYEDDGQVVALEVCKRYGPDPCTVVAIECPPADLLAHAPLSLAAGRA